MEVNKCLYIIVQKQISIYISDNKSYTEGEITEKLRAESKQEKADAIRDTVASTIEKYRMFSKDKPVPIGYSGGKDSATLIFVLDKLGYEVRPVIVERGYDPRFAGNKIAETLYSRTKIKADVIKLRGPAFYKTISLEASKIIHENLLRVDNIKEGETLCTPCYNARTTAMVEYAKNVGAQSFAIGQHKTDMITSLMKSYWTEKYYYTFTKTEGVPYDGIKMKEFIQESQIDLDYLHEMVENGRAATDDPPIEIIGDMKLVRPLEAVSERETKAYANDYPHESDNCSYREKEPRPFRLLVQFDLAKRIERNPNLETILYKFVLRGLNDDGTLKFRPRNSRESLYPGFKSFIRKVGSV